MDKKDEAPMHPDDLWPPLSDKAYQSLLKKYNDWLERTK